MTWRQLFDLRPDFTEAQLDQPMRFYESYDDDPVTVECTLTYNHAEDVIQMDSQLQPDGSYKDVEIVTIPAGEPYLS